MGNLWLGAPAVPPCKPPGSTEGGAQKGTSRGEVGAAGSFSAEADTPIACPGRRHLEEAAPSAQRRLGGRGAGSH